MNSCRIYGWAVDSMVSYPASTHTFYLVSYMLDANRQIAVKLQTGESCVKHEVEQP